MVYRTCFSALKVAPITKKILNNLLIIKDFLG